VAASIAILIAEIREVGSDILVWSKRSLPSRVPVGQRTSAYAPLGSSSRPRCPCAAPRAVVQNAPGRIHASPIHGILLVHLLDPASTVRVVDSSISISVRSGFTAAAQRSSFPAAEAGTPERSLNGRSRRARDEDDCLAGRGRLACANRITHGLAKRADPDDALENSDRTSRDGTCASPATSAGEQRPAC